MNNDLFSTRAKPELKTWYYHALLSYVTILATVVSHIYAYDRAKTLSFILLIRRKSTEFENESNV